VKHLPLADPGTPDLGGAGRFLRWLGRRQWRLLGVGIAWGILWMLAQAAVPAALGAGIQAVSDKDRTGFVTWAVVVLGLGVVQAAAGVFRHRAAVANWLTAASRVQQLVVVHAARLGTDLPRQVATGEVVAVTGNDVERIGNAFDVIARFVGAIVAFFAISVVLLNTSLFLGLVVLVGVPLLMLVVAPLVRPLERREREQRAMFGATTELAADTVAGLRVLRGIGGEELFLDRFRTASDAVRTAGIRTSQVRALLDALQVALPGVFVVLVTWLGARSALAGNLQVGQLVAFYGYTAFLVMPLRTVTETAHKWTAARVAATRVVSLLALERQQPEPTRPADDPGHGPLVDHASGFVAEPGRLTAVVAVDPGSGSRLADRLGGYAEGLVSLAGVPLVELTTEVVRTRVLVQDTDPVLLTGPVADLFDVPRSGRVSVEEAISWSAAQDIVEGLPDGLATDLPERGRSLSGGQRQRIALARSLVVDPGVLVLDEPTSAVDAHTEARIGRLLKQARAGRTTVVVTSSPLLLDQADLVVLIEDDQVVATGTHAELMHTHALYRAVVVREDAEPAATAPSTEARR